MTFIDYRKRHQALRERGATVRAEIAELVSEGWSLSAAARHLGIIQQMASKHWAQIRADMGDQAR